MNKDQKLLAEIYDGVVTGSLSDFESRIKTRAKKGYGYDNVYFFGVTPEGKKYAVIEEYDKYDDGDRWIEEINHYYEVEGETGKYISDALAKELKTKAYQEHPELNKHINPEMFKA